MASVKMMMIPCFLIISIVMQSTWAVDTTCCTDKSEDTCTNEDSGTYPCQTLCYYDTDGTSPIFTDWYTCSTVGGTTTTTRYACPNTKECGKSAYDPVTGDCTKTVTTDSTVSSDSTSPTTPMTSSTPSSTSTSSSASTSTPSTSSSTSTSSSASTSTPSTSSSTSTPASTSTTPMTTEPCCDYTKDQAMAMNTDKPCTSEGSFNCSIPCYTDTDGTTKYRRNDYYVCINMGTTYRKMYNVCPYSNNCTNTWMQMTSSTGKCMQ